VDEADIAALDYCYVTTTGRRSGRPHTVEIWFALHGRTLYLLSGGGDGSDWVKNIQANPTVGMRVGDRDMICRGRLIEDAGEDDLARRLLVEKYQPRYEGNLAEWRETSLPVAIDLPER
jgi:deazaflavin-dependent oxidoreductase (nitroreductase family)